MKTLTDLDNTIDALKDVSTNALSKHGFSRSRQRMVDLSINLSQAWENYKVIHGSKYRRELCLFVINRSSNGLKLQSIKRRTGFDFDQIKACLDWLTDQGHIECKIKNLKVIYSTNKK